jgi:Response regulators consisting of a CheY-like receiver domain and a winged-helix DNA-binding domain
MYNILVVDDEQKIREVIKEYAEFEGHSITEAEDGMSAVNICREKDFDIIIMDVMMPRLDGFSTVKEIKKFKDIPVLMLSARGEEYDKLFGFEMGIDDYVTKPFSPKELMARLNIIVKRNKGNRLVSSENTAQRLVFDKLEIDLLGRSVFINSKKIDLTMKEYDLLVYLAKNNKIALTRDKLLNEVWGYDFYGDDRTVDAHIKMLRSSIKEYRDFIVTLRGVGYKFEA